MFENFRSVLDNSELSSVQGSEKSLYRELTSDMTPLVLYDSSDMAVEVYEARAPLEDINHPFRPDNCYLVRFELSDQYVGFLTGRESDVSAMDEALVEELDEDDKYKKILRDLS